MATETPSRLINVAWFEQLDGDARYPALAVAPNGDAIVIWWHILPSGFPDGIWFNRYD